jgi:hypothetical protein
MSPGPGGLTVIDPVVWPFRTGNVPLFDTGPPTVCSLPALRWAPPLLKRGVAVLSAAGADHVALTDVGLPLVAATQTAQTVTESLDETAHGTSVPVYGWNFVLPGTGAASRPRSDWQVGGWGRTAVKGVVSEGMGSWFARLDQTILFGFLVFLVGVVAHVSLLVIVGLAIEVVGLARATTRRRRQ